MPVPGRIAQCDNDRGALASTLAPEDQHVRAEADRFDHERSDVFGHCLRCSKAARL